MERCNFRFTFNSLSNTNRKKDALFQLFPKILGLAFITELVSAVMALKYAD